MNAETNSSSVETALAAATTMQTVNELRRTTGLDEPTVRAQLKALAQQGQIEHIPGRGRYDGRYGLLRPIAKAAPVEASSDVALTDEGKTAGDSEGGEADARAIPAPEYDPDSVAFSQARTPSDTEMSLLNVIADIRAAVGDTTGKIMLGDLAEHIRATISAGEQKRLETTTALTRSMHDLDAIREHLAPFSGEIDPSDMTEVELAASAAAAIRDGLERIFSANSGEVAANARGEVAELDNARAPASKLEHLLGVERQTSAALREQLDHITHGGEPAAQGLCASLIDSYAVIAPKRPMRRFTAHDSAVKSAMAAASNGSKRGEVFALVHIGSAKRGAVWSPVK